jgi:hypothetical protein
MNINKLVVATCKKVVGGKAPDFSIIHQKINTRGERFKPVRVVEGGAGKLSPGLDDILARDECNQTETAVPPVFRLFKLGGFEPR